MRYAERFGDELFEKLFVRAFGYGTIPFSLKYARLTRERLR
jgi:hypothetical protein